MTARDVARRERTLLCGLFDDLGPQAPTLCAGWTARDLAAHLYVREREPLAAAGLVLRPLARLTEARMHTVAQRPWADLVDSLRAGPPAPMSWVEGQANLIEFVVHREDLRRAARTPAPEDRDAQTLDIIWERLRSAAPLLFRGRAVTLRCDGRVDITTRSGTAARVVLTGQPVDILLVATGREAAVDIAGDLDAVSAFKAQRRSI